jgi:hypothetical protein
MKTLTRNIVLLAATFLAAGALAGTPTVEVTVRPAAGGKAVQKTTTDASGTFMLHPLAAGEYTLEFHAKPVQGMRGEQFTLSIAGTRHSGTQGGITGTSLVGGVALNVDVAAGARVVGEVRTGSYAGQRYWEPANLGSHLPGHWTSDAHTAPAYNIVNVPEDIVRKMQDTGGDGARF